MIILSILVWASIKSKSIPWCLSECYYIIGGWFSILMVIASIILLPFILDHTPETYQFLAFFTLSGLIFVAFAPKYKDKFEGNVHYVSAIISGVSSLLWTFFCGDAITLIVLSILASLLLIIDRNRWLLWVELGCILSVLISLL